LIRSTRGGGIHRRRSS